MSKPSKITEGGFASARLRRVGKRSTVAASWQCVCVCGSVCVCVWKCVCVCVGRRGVCVYLCIHLNACILVFTVRKRNLHVIILIMVTHKYTLKSQTTYVLICYTQKSFVALVFSALEKQLPSKSKSHNQHAARMLLIYKHKGLLATVRVT